MDQPDTGIEQPQEGTTGEGQVDRRQFIKGSGALIALAGASALTISCDVNLGQDDEADATPTPIPTDEQYPGTIGAPPETPDPSILRTFTVHEAETVEALTARILPGTPEDPGAREAGVVTYIDFLLSQNEGLVETTYREPPYAMVYTGDEPPEGDDYDVIWIPASEARRYGYQSILTPRDVYRIGIVAVDQAAAARFGNRFVNLSEQEQDQIVGDMANNQVEEFDEQTLSAAAFFHTLHRHTAEGMFADPGYGGNRDLVGWQLVGFPGAQRGYTPQDLRNESFHREPQAMFNLTPFNAGHADHPNVLLPVSGSEDEDRE